MARFSGMVGYAQSLPDPEFPSVYVDTVVERKRYGDVIREHSKWQPNQNLNDDLEITNRVSIVADKFSLENMGNMKYITMYGQRWSIKSVTVEHPRLIVYLGGLYNGPTPEGV